MDFIEKVTCEFFKYLLASTQYIKRVNKGQGPESENILLYYVAHQAFIFTCYMAHS